MGCCLPRELPLTSCAGQLTCALQGVPLKVWSVAQLRHSKHLAQVPDQHVQHGDDQACTMQGAPARRGWFRRQLQAAARTLQAKLPPEWLHHKAAPLFALAAAVAVMLAGILSLQVLPRVACW